jgi:glucose/arabinose dehydrogenase
LEIFTMSENKQRRAAGLMLAAVGGLALVACGTTRLHAGGADTRSTPMPSNGGVLTGQTALQGDFSTDAPGVTRRITVADLPPPHATPSVDNGAPMIPRPDGAMPKVPAGFAVEEFATGLNNPRNIVTAPNGDIFVVESGPNRVRVLRDTHGTGKPDVNEIFCEGLKQPFGLAFYPLGPDPKWVYVGNTDSVVRFPYHNGDLKATGPGETIVDDISGGGRLRGGGHWTRDVVFSKGGDKMFVSVGSRSNVMEDPTKVDDEQRRARIFEFNPDGSDEQVYATGIRNAVGLAVDPSTGQLWCSVNERDGLGDNLVPDYITHVTPGGFIWAITPMSGPPARPPPGPISVSSSPTCSCSLTRRRSRWRSTRPGSSPRATTAARLPPSMAPGTAPAGPATKSSLSRSRRARPSARTRIS